MEGAHETRIDGPKVERRERAKGKKSLVELSGLGRWDLSEFEKIRLGEERYIPKCWSNKSITWSYVSALKGHLGWLSYQYNKDYSKYRHALTSTVEESSRCSLI